MTFTNARIFTGSEFEAGEFFVENGRFSSSGSAGSTDLQGAYVIPGLIDIHTHGNSGCDFYDANVEGLEKMARFYASKGVTSFCPASMTLPYDDLSKAFACA